MIESIAKILIRGGGAVALTLLMVNSLSVVAQPPRKKNAPHRGASHHPCHSRRPQSWRR